jgi:hypothetical protein
MDFIAKIQNYSFKPKPWQKQNQEEQESSIDRDEQMGLHYLDTIILPGLREFHRVKKLSKKGYLLYTWGKWSMNGRANTLLVQHFCRHACA